MVSNVHMKRNCISFNINMQLTTYKTMHSILKTLPYFYDRMIFPNNVDYIICHKLFVQIKAILLLHSIMDYSISIWYVCKISRYTRCSIFVTTSSKIRNECWSFMQFEGWREKVFMMFLASIMRHIDQTKSSRLP